MRFVTVAALLGLGLGLALRAFGQGSAPLPDWPTPRQGAPSRGAVSLALQSPQTAAALERIDGYLRTESPLGPRLASLLPLITARELNLAYEWRIREAAALEAGLEPAVIETIRQSAPLARLSSDDALLVDFGRQLWRARHVETATFAAVLARLGRQGTFDAIMLLTYPAMAGVLQRALDPQQPADPNREPLPRLAGVGTPTGQPAEFVALAARPALPSDVREDSYYRFPLLKRAELDARGRAIFDRVVGTERDTAPRGPVGMTLLSPELVEPVQAINTALRENGALGTRLAEIVIAATGREMNSQYQWNVHGGAAERAGAGAAVLEAIGRDGDLERLNERDAIAIRFTREIFREEAVRPETFATALELLGAQGTVELVALIGDYLMMTTVYNALGMRLRDDQEATLPHRAGAPVGAEWR
jgi:4-carboxymuconolactone decarboxylase